MDDADLPSMGGGDTDFILETPVWEIENIKNWDERISHYSDEKKALYKRMIPRLDKLRAMKDDEDWNNLVTDNKKKIYIDSKKSENGLMMMRASGPIDAAPIDVWRYVNYGVERMDYDSSCKECTTLSKEGVNAYRLYSQSKRVMIVKGRDFVLE